MKPRPPAMRTTAKHKRLLLAALLLAALVSPASAHAHVKWFSSWNVTQPPKPFLEVASTTFFIAFAAFVVMLFLGLLLDGWLAKRWPALKSAGSTHIDVHEKWVRLGTGAFLLCTWAIGLDILTADLPTTTSWIFTVQFISAFSLAWKRTSIVGALGICTLYIYGITQYGFFHMLDYVFFLGIAVFLAGISIPAVTRIRVGTITGCLAFSIMWTAIEKFLYPQWTQQVLEHHHDLLMGMPPALLVVIAGFAEFTLAFFLAIGRGMLRVGALVLLLIFISAMPEFGRIDVVGHLPLVAILGVPLMGGNSALQRFWRLPGRGQAINALVACALYSVSLCIFLLSYYGVQKLEYPH